MKKYIPVLFFLGQLLIIAFPASAQDAIKVSEILKNKNDISIHDISRINHKVVVADSLQGWQLMWVGGLNGAEAAYNNWSHGGVNTLSITASTIYNMKYRKDRFAYAFSTNLKYGKAKVEGQGIRKTDDLIAINNKFSYLFGDGVWSAFGNINLATQIDQGYDYNVPDDQDPTLVSNFFAPAYFTQIWGIAYSPADYFSGEAGLAMKETIVRNSTLSTRYGLKPGNKFRFEPGYSIGLNFDNKIFSHVRLISSVETFTNLQRHIDNTDVNFSNEMIGKINDFMNMSFQFVMIYDSDFNRRVQIKQVLSAGLSVNIL